MFKFLSYLANRLTRLFGGKEAYGPFNRDEGLSLPNHHTGTAVYLIFNPTWPDPPRKWYSTPEAALRDANDLVRKQPQDTFYIMKAIQLVQTGPFIVKELPGGPR